MRKTVIVSTIMHSSRDAIQTAERIGKAVRQARKEMGVDQQELALVASVSRRTVYAIEHGKPTARLDAVVAVLAALGLELATVERAQRRREP